MLEAEAESVSSLMAEFRAGGTNAGAKLMELFYPELRRMAAAHLMRERPGHSWQPTLLVNELYLELTKIKALRPAEREYDDDRAAFFALAGLLMRRMLMRHARPLSKKAIKVPLWDEVKLAPEKQLSEIEELLSRLEAIDPVIRTVVEKKIFDGYTAAEISHQLGCSAVTVNRHWQFARHWLQAEL